MSDARRMFPILNDDIIRAIPWDAIAPHEAQAQVNHGQSLRGLAGRGGLSIEEAYCVLKNMKWPYGAKWDKAAVRVALMKLTWGAERSAAQEARHDPA